MNLTPDATGRYTKAQADQLALAGYEVCECTLMLDAEPMYIIVAQNLRPMEDNPMELPCPMM